MQTAFYALLSAVFQRVIQQKVYTDGHLRSCSRTLFDRQMGHSRAIGLWKDIGHLISGTNVLLCGADLN